jgi:hypothetical protein
MILEDETLILEGILSQGGGGLPRHWGKAMKRGRKLRSSAPFICGGERVCDDRPERWHQAGPARTRRGNCSLVSVRFVHGHGRFEADLDHCSIGPGPIRSNKSFSIIQMSSNL